MFVRERNYNNAIQKVRIDVGSLVGLDKDEEAFIVLCELPTLEMAELKIVAPEGEAALLKHFEKLLPKIIVDHNFYETEQRKMSNEELASFVFEKTELTAKILKTYVESSFFTQPKPNEDK